MMIEISELQRRRASNIIWNAAGSHDFNPTFHAYTNEGEADIYWNCIFGAIRRHYDYPQLETVFRTLQDYEEADLYEGLLWLGLENAVFAHEMAARPVLKGLRQTYAGEFLRHNATADDYDLYGALATGHYRRVLGQEPQLSRYDITLLDELEFLPEMNTEEIIEKAKQLFDQWFRIRLVEKRIEKRSIRNPFRKAQKLKEKKDRYRRFGIGFAERREYAYGGTAGEKTLARDRLNTRLTEQELRAFMAFKYGKPAFSERELQRLERELCHGSHQNCRLHITRGEKYEGNIVNGFEALQKEKEAKQIQRNRMSYEVHLAQNTLSVNRLSAKIQNSVLLHLHPAQVKATAGTFEGGRIWRAIHLGDERVFAKTEQSDMGDLSVDILLDASTSQRERQETVSAQGYMIAEALKKSGIPCRVTAFNSMTGFTILKLLTDYTDIDNKKIFQYVANGCNRDGLAIRTVHELMKQTPWEHKILIVLSDVKPNDVQRIREPGQVESVPYESEAGIRDIAREVRSARNDGISVICVFTGEDEDLTAAKTVFDRDFARIKSLDMLADTVGMLLQNRIRNL